MRRRPRQHDLERAAVSCATHGLSTFRLKPRSKVPLRQGWKSEATTDANAIADLWKATPDANIGIRSGNGLVIVDVDQGDALRDLELPDTTTVATGRGQHLYFSGDAPNRVAVRPGLDIRGRGGFGVGYGSIHPNGSTYDWVVPPWEVAPAQAPAELLDLIRKRPDQTRHDRPIPEGQRNKTLTSRGGSLRRAGHSKTAIAAALQAENRACCRPPLPPDEIAKLAGNVARMPSPAPWRVDPFEFATDPRLSPHARHRLVALANRARTDGHVHGGHPISGLTGLHRNTIGRAVAELEQTGRLTIRRRQGAANEYRLIATSNSPDRLNARTTTSEPPNFELPNRNHHHKGLCAPERCIKHRCARNPIGGAS